MAKKDMKKKNELNEESLNQVAGGTASNMTAHGAYGSKEWEEYYKPEMIGGKDGCYHGANELSDDALSNVSGGVTTETSGGMIGGGDGIYNPEGSRFVGPGGINPENKSRFVGPGGINPENKSRFVGPGGIRKK